MINVLISGALGKMGKKVYDACILSDKVIPVCGVDLKDDFSNNSYPVYSSFNDNIIAEMVDVVIDFSSPANLNNVLNFCLNKKIPAVLCATGYSQNDVEKIQNASKQIAVFRSGNMSLGVNVLIDLVKKATKSLEGFDVEIIEKHHNQKVDAPSGTALMLAEGVKQVNPEKYYVYGREGICGKRDKNEIGIHAVRGGGIVGEHEVIFASGFETITLSHLATDRSVFADGAVKASIYIADKKSGLYNMSDVINGK
ncbi:MAG: 4-hydroxy-tetrahydrodipicolinate reductase [Clostridiales bacterium]|nr:4-hydroxy-tetrahydrodipicolinate reductase [Clostridiales bacterium]